MPKKRKEDYDWMKERLQILLDIGKKVPNEDPTNDYGSYTAMKLISVNYYSAVFSGVARHPNRKLEGFDGAVYIDLFAGAGLVKLSDTGDYVGGSTLCALSNSKGFDFCVAIEKSKERASVLEKRLSAISPDGQFRVINDDCNECIDQAISVIKGKYQKPIVLAFVDPEGMEIRWDTLKKLSDAFFSCDFMINVSSSGSLRVAGKLKKGMDEVKETFSDYWGEDAEVVLSEFAEGKTPETKYGEKIGTLGRRVGDIIPIRDNGNNVVYYLLGYTRMTTGGSQYASAFKTLNDRFRNMDRASVTNILNHINARGTGPLF
ncbi:MAG TPA: three-Cys-motif partner protein TcmP [Candidatus Nitrosotalea sp.]|nr:three-Cys-motif partner protein TcmP [Candidatus Nitrosotalea sp.]